MMLQLPEITFVIVTYNPVLYKLLTTIKSILIQTNITYEIIISDDGSTIFPENEIKDYFKRYNFNNYKILISPKNEGTVHNFYKGVKQASGQYVKGISPGDYLYGENCIFNWLQAMKKSNAGWSFSDYINYHYEDEQIKTISLPSHPRYTKPYKANKNFSGNKNYLINNDIALGAATLIKRNILLSYLNKIIGKIKYAEDNIYRLMMCDNVPYLYYPHDTILYENGIGISTCQSDKWSKLIKLDWLTTNQLIYTTCTDKCKIKKPMKLIDKLNKLPMPFRVLGKILCFYTLKRYLTTKFLKPNYTNTEEDENFMNKLSSKQQ